jgi:hypothetical protein
MVGSAAPGVSFPCRAEHLPAASRRGTRELDRIIRICGGERRVDRDGRGTPQLEAGRYMAEESALGEQDVAERPWYAVPADEAVEALGTDGERGLSEREVERRRARGRRGGRNRRDRQQERPEQEQRAAEKRSADEADRRRRAG